MERFSIQSRKVTESVCRELSKKRIKLIVVTTTDLLLTCERHISYHEGNYSQIKGRKREGIRL